MDKSFSKRLIRSRRDLMVDPSTPGGAPALEQALPPRRRADEAAEGGCGVLGFAANILIAGRHVLAASQQMHNRGNGKGGGIAMVGLDPAQMGVDAETLRTHYLLQVALLDPAARAEVEQQYILPHFDIAQAYEVERVDDFRAIEGLEVRPPGVWRYFVRVKPEILARFVEEKGLSELLPRAVEDEFVYQNSFRLNRDFYASLGEKRAFVLCHGRDQVVLKIVGYAEQMIDYYCLHDEKAHVWIAHQRYPTKGRVWHPGGAHPFIGLNEALVHNGDFANYHAVSEYLRQRNIAQLFLTDTEVSVQLFDLWDRVYGYPLEVTLEAMAPTTEHDFAMLPPEKQVLYRAIQRTHIHGSPDGPWFFIVARSHPDENRHELLGITDTSMLRPQVFALYDHRPPTNDQRPTSNQQPATSNQQPATNNPCPERSRREQRATSNEQPATSIQIGLIASERQAINACLRSLAAEDERFQPVADKYWVARGGSHTDGGAFCFTVSASPGGGSSLSCANKFGQPVVVRSDGEHLDRRRLDPSCASTAFRRAWEEQAFRACDNGGAPTFWAWLGPALPSLTWDELAWGLDWLRDFARQGGGNGEWSFALQTLSLLRDRRYDPGQKRRASVIGLVDEGLKKLLDETPLLVEGNSSPSPAGRGKVGVGVRLTWDLRNQVFPRNTQSEPCEGLELRGTFARLPWNYEESRSTLVLDALGFPPEGEECAARWMVRAYEGGWRHLVVYNWRGGRFAACGLGSGTEGTRVDLYGDVGDYAGSGLDGAEVHLHGDGQDQLGQILKSGKLVVYGDVGQTFLYGAKGGEIYVLGSAAGRPLINAVGRPRAVINGTCLDYLAESFMAGDPLQGGGFVVLNGVTLDEAGQLVDLETPYPGGNLFSLASGGAIYLRDPHRRVDEDQLNGGAFAELSQADWALIEPYLGENERLFGIRVDDLLTVDGERRAPREVYRKVEVRGAGVLSD